MLLYDCCDRLLEVVVDALDELPAGAPELQFITDLDPLLAYGDCPLVAVAMPTNSLFPSINVRARGPSLPARPTMNTSLSQAVFSVWFTRGCYPVQTDKGKIPPAADISAATEQVLDDRYKVWTTLRDECRDGTLFDTLLAGNDNAAVEPPSTPVTPSGNIAGTVMSVMVDLIALPEGS